MRIFSVQLMVLDAVPDLDLIGHLSEFLDGLFVIFKDRNAEIRKMLVWLVFPLKLFCYNYTTFNCRTYTVQSCRCTLCMALLTWIVGQNEINVKVISNYSS